MKVKGSKHKIVLYNPEAVFYTMPLSLLAIASYLDPEQFEICIIDARLEKNAHAKTIDACRDAICIGITVLTGAPISDALNLTKKLKLQFPDLPVVWGGWHPSLFPEQTLFYSGADVVIKGQGEITFEELLQRIIQKQTFEGLPGIVYQQNGAINTNPERHLSDINLFPAFNYNYIDVPAYNHLSGRRQLDYISSQGCRFRCHFCADPAMYNRGWTAYSPERVAEEIDHWKKQYNFEHVHFQDETFFTSAKRVEEIAVQFLEKDLNISWFATMRADQGDRMGEDLFKLCKRSGLERVMIGVESGSQRMLDHIKKDIRIEQVFKVAEICNRFDIAINFSMIVGFPGEPEEDLNETLRVTKELRKMNPEFRTSIFYFKPYPGNPIADQLKADGYRFPETLEEWAQFDYVGPVKNDWISKTKFRQIEGFKFYQRLAWSKKKFYCLPLQQLARLRCENDFYFFPFEKFFANVFYPGAKMS